MDQQLIDFFAKNVPVPTTIIAAIRNIIQSMPINQVVLPENGISNGIIMEIGG